MSNKYSIFMLKSQNWFQLCMCLTYTLVSVCTRGEIGFNFPKPVIGFQKATIMTG